MTFLPIVERELRARARRPATHWSRWVVAVVAGMLAFHTLFSFASFDAAEGGRQAYLLLLGVGLMLACAATLLTADALSRERREGTLGFLFLTDLKGYDVVLGKLVAGGLAGFYGLLGLAPALALPLLVGGVTLGEVFRATLTLLNVLFVSLAAGLWVSTRAVSQFQAMRNAALLVLGIMVLPLIVGKALEVLGIGFPLAILSPYVNLTLGSDFAFGAKPVFFWRSLLVAHLAGWFWLLAAAHGTARNWHESNSGKIPTTTANGATSRRRFNGAAPVVWRVSQLPGQGALMWTAALLAVLVNFPYFFWLSFGVKLGLGEEGFYQGTDLALVLGEAALFAWVAGRFFLEARRSGELELLASTPAGTRELVSGQWVCLWRRLRWVVLFLVVVKGLPVGLLTASGSYGPTGVPWVFSAIAGVTSVADIVASVLALIWLGMWFGLRARGPLMAVALAVGLVKGLPWIVSAIFNLALAWSRQYRVGPRGAPVLLAFVYFGLPVVFFGLNLFLIWWAKRRLQRQLQAGALFQPGRGARERLNAAWALARRARHWTPS